MVDFRPNNLLDFGVWLMGEQKKGKYPIQTVVVVGSAMVDYAKFVEEEEEKRLFDE